MVRTSRLAPVTAALMASVAIPATALAQSVTQELGQEAQSNFARDRNVAVRERPHPEYEAIGARVGGFMLFPRIEGDILYDTNVFATPSNTQGDTIFRVKPDVSLVSNWNRHFLQLQAGADIGNYSRFSSENTVDWNAAALGRLDFAARTKLTGQIRHDRVTEARSSDNGGILGAALPKPVRYDDDNARLTLSKEFNRLKLTGDASWDQTRYANDGPFQLNLRDRTQTMGMGRADYALSPATALFVEVSANNRDYRLHPAGIKQPDSNGYLALVGTNFELGHLARGEVGVGYESQNYHNSAFADVKGFGFRGKVEWFPSQLTTVTLDTSRSIEDSGILIPFGAQRTAGGFLYSQGSVKVDHELLRNVIVTANGGISQSQFKTINRTDDRYTFGLSGTYLMNRHIGINAGYTYLHQNSRGTNLYLGPRFSDNRVGASIIYQF